MINLTRKALLLVCCTLLTMSTMAQEMSKTVVQEISKQASKGELYDYLIDEENNRIELAYLLKETKKTMFMETYVFKLDDLSFVSSTEEEIQKEKAKYKRVKWGKTEPTKLLKIFPNFINGKLILKRGYISYGYAGRAVISSFVSEDGGTQVTTQGGDKFIYLAHQTESQSLNGKTTVLSSDGAANVSAAGTFGLGYMSIGEGNVSIVGMEKTKPYYTKYAFTIYDAKTRAEKLYQTFDLGYSYNPMSVEYLPNGDIGIVFRPILEEFLPKTKGAKEKFVIDTEKNFKYVQINTKGEKVTDVNFHLEMGKKGGSYSIDIIPTDVEGEIVLLGLSKPEQYAMGTATNPKYLAPTFNSEKGMYVHKAENVVVLKIVGDKVVFKKDATIESSFNNVQTTEGTKQPKPGAILQSCRTFNAISDADGNILINAIGSIHEVIQIDTDGNITCYLDQQDQDWAQMNELIKNEAEEVFWINFDISKFDPASSEDTQKAAEKRTGVISKIDSKGGKIEKTISLTPDGIALDIAEPLKMINDNEILVLGKGKKKQISLSKIILN